MRKIITIITLFLILTSCSEYKDTNGEDDYTLQSITDDGVDDSNYSVIGSFRNVIKNKGSYRVKNQQCFPLIPLVKEPILLR